MELENTVLVDHQRANDLGAHLRAVGLVSLGLLGHMLMSHQVS